MSTPDLDWLRGEVRHWLNMPGLDAAQRAYYHEFLHRLDAVELAFEDALIEAEALGVRCPAFAGDHVGWLPDDFT